MQHQIYDLETLYARRDALEARERDLCFAFDAADTEQQQRPIEQALDETRDELDDIRDRIAAAEDDDLVDSGYDALNEWLANRAFYHAGVL